MEGKFVKVHTAAKYYGVTKWTIRRWIAEEKLNAKKDPGGRCWLVELVEKSKEEKPDTAPETAKTPFQGVGGRSFVTDF